MPAAIPSSGHCGLNLNIAGLTTYSSNTGNVATGNLANFYGAGAAQQGSITETVHADKTAGAANAGSNLTVSATSAHAAVVTYNYITQAHANGALDNLGNNTLSLSIGNLASGTLPTALNFDLYNTLGSYGLQVIGVTQTAGNGIFTLGGLGSVSNLAGGASVQGNIGMAAQAPLATSNYLGTWMIVVADSSTGTPGLGLNTTNVEALNLSVSATVAAAAPVPEPESYAMLLAGLGALGFMGRRRSTVHQAS
ncbi:MAG: hypothetical protein RIQ60_2996 [Pseudomonadota bacterium]|jgi:hypothetical protein